MLQFLTQALPDIWHLLREKSTVRLPCSRTFLHIIIFKRGLGRAQMNPIFVYKMCNYTTPHLRSCSKLKLCLHTLDLTLNQLHAWPSHINCTVINQPVLTLLTHCGHTLNTHTQAVKQHFVSLRWMNIPERNAKVCVCVCVWVNSGVVFGLIRLPVLCWFSSCVTPQIRERCLYA